MGSLSYLKDTHECKPFDPPMNAPRLISFDVGSSTFTLIKKFCVSCVLLFSTSTTSPNRLPISATTIGDIMSKGASHICIHRAIESNLTLAAVIPSCHRRSINAWLSKVQGPPLSTRSNSKLDLNLNWNKFEPTSTICSSSSNPQDLLSVFWAAFYHTSILQVIIPV